MDSNNRNDVARDIETGRREGRYKDCVHLTIGDSQDHPQPGYRFYTRCLRDCLEEPPDPYLPLPFPAITETQCPKNCRFFEDRSAAERKRQQAAARALWWGRVKWALGLVPRFLNWFGTAPWQTQILIILLAILIFAPWYASALSQMLKAVLHGQ